MPNSRQPPVGGVYGEARNAVVASVRNIQEFPRRGDLDLGAGVSSGVAVGQGCYRLKSRQGSRRSVQTITGYTAALLVRKVDDVLGWMKAVVAGAKAFPHLQLERRVGRKTASVFVEFKLKNHIGPRCILSGFHDVIE